MLEYAYEQILQGRTYGLVLLNSRLSTCEVEGSGNLM